MRLIWMRFPDAVPLSVMNWVTTVKVWVVSTVMEGP